MAAAASESLSSGGPGAVRLPRLPPLKVLAGQLRRHAEGGPGAWRLSRAAVGRAPLELVAVWMQGTVLAAEGGQARLRDSSGAFSVRGLERVPRGRPCLLPGFQNLKETTQLKRTLLPASHNMLDLTLLPASYSMLELTYLHHAAC
uniref:Isoform 2 of RecQ-mediated genome instability protein 2 n=1 Tax=Mus musculus TaxID=10090 RepID=Q3UPE3-2|nr:unnamed protein product [Mus musculus]